MLFADQRHFHKAESVTPTAIESVFVHQQAHQEFVGKDIYLHFVIHKLGKQRGDLGAVVVDLSFVNGKPGMFFLVAGIGGGQEGWIATFSATYR